MFCLVFNCRVNITWYDNEWGYSCRVGDLATYMVKKGLYFSDDSFIQVVSGELGGQTEPEQTTTYLPSEMVERN